MEGEILMTLLQEAEGLVERFKPVFGMESWAVSVSLAPPKTFKKTREYWGVDEVLADSVTFPGERRLVIRINEGLDWTDRNLPQTVAHEFGHAVLIRSGLDEVLDKLYQHEVDGVTTEHKHWAQDAVNRSREEAIDEWAWAVVRAMGKEAIDG